MFKSIDENTHIALPYCAYPAIFVHNFCTFKRRLTGMRDVSITEFRANLLKYLKVAQVGETINVTSKGMPLATLVAPVARHHKAKEKLKRLSKTAVINDIVSPTDGHWDAMQ